MGLALYFVLCSKLQSTVTEKAHAQARKGKFPLYRKLESAPDPTHPKIQERRLITCFMLDSEFYIGMLVVEIVQKRKCLLLKSEEQKIDRKSEEQSARYVMMIHENT